MILKTIKSKIKVAKTYFFKHFPKPKQWAGFFSVLSKKERVIFSGLLLLFFASTIFLQLEFYFKNTEVLPQNGGKYKEGLVGQPRFVNPLYLSDNDIDRDLTEIIFSGLLKYGEDGKIIKDIAESYEIKDGKEYDFDLKKNVFWHDGKKLTAEDVIFTINLIQSPQYRSSLRIEWLGVKAESSSEEKIIFRLQNPYSSFLETVARLKIIPKHVFQDISPDDFPWSLITEKYLIGTGAFKVKRIKTEGPNQIKKIVLEKNENFYGEKPYLDEMSFYFYENNEDLVKAARIGEIDGFSASNPQYLKILEKEGFEAHRLFLPRYFALFFNLRNSSVSNKKIREAISYSINKKELLDEIFLSEGTIAESPIINDYYGFEAPEKVFEFNPEKAIEILESEGYRLNSETGIREKEVKKQNIVFKQGLEQGNQGTQVKALQECLKKENLFEDEISSYFGPKTKEAVSKFQEKYFDEILKPAGLKSGTGKVGTGTAQKLNEVCQENPQNSIPLKFSLVTCDNFPLSEIADAVSRQLKSIGIQLSVEKVSLADFQTNILNKRNFEILLFGEALGQMPDPFPFWHSSQKEYPGLNVSSYSSKSADGALEASRETSKESEIKKNLEKFQNLVIEDLPAVFLSRGNYFYFLNPKIKGFTIEKITDSSKRFSLAEKLFIKKKRVWIK